MSQITTIQVAVIETSVVGVLAYHAECLTCGIRVCDHAAHPKESSAVVHAEAHVCVGVTL